MPNYYDFGDKSPKIIAQLTIDSSETILRHIQEKGKYEMKIDGETVNIVRSI